MSSETLIGSYPLRRDNPLGEQTFDVLGIPVRAIQIPEVIEVMQYWIENRERGRYITFTNVHAITEAVSNIVFREVLKSADICAPDGMPLIWTARRQQKALRRRVYGPECFWEFLRATQDKPYAHFFYGGKQGVGEQLCLELKKQFPTLRVAGMLSPPFRPLTAEEDRQIIDQINASGADVLWVGLGCPKQEIWMYEHRKELNVPVMAGVGQAFDIYAGTLRQAPRWMRESGLEWLFRLCLEPKRLARRYLVGNSKFLYWMLRSGTRNRA